MALKFIYAVFITVFNKIAFAAIFTPNELPGTSNVVNGDELSFVVYFTACQMNYVFYNKPYSHKWVILHILCSIDKPIRYWFCIYSENLLKIKSFFQDVVLVYRKLDSAHEKLLEGQIAYVRADSYN